MHGVFELAYQQAKVVPEFRNPLCLGLLTLVLQLPTYLIFLLSRYRSAIWHYFLSSAYHFGIIKKIRNLISAAYYPEIWLIKRMEGGRRSEMLFSSSKVSASSLCSIKIVSMQSLGFFTILLKLNFPSREK
jgi:hypothetical protein